MLHSHDIALILDGQVKEDWEDQDITQLAQAALGGEWTTDHRRFNARVVCVFPGTWDGPQNFLVAPAAHPEEPNLPLSAYSDPIPIKVCTLIWGRRSVPQKILGFFLF